MGWGWRRAIMRFAWIAVATDLLLVSTASAQLSDPPKADECEAYYRFELQVIEEQRHYLNQAAIKAVEAKQPAPDEKPRLIEQARAETDERFTVDYDAAKRSRDRCLKRAK